MPKSGDRNWSRSASAKLSAATLRDGERSLALKVSGKSFRIPIGDTSWSNDALVEVTYAPTASAAEPASGPAAPLTRTAGETPRTAP